MVINILCQIFREGFGLRSQNTLLKWSHQKKALALETHGEGDQWVYHIGRLFCGFVFLFPVAVQNKRPALASLL